MIEYKAPPHANGPEKSILSTMLQDPVEFIPRAIEYGITPEKFYSPAHSLFFKLISEKQSAGQVVELIKLTEEVTESGLLEKLGGASSLAELYSYAPTSAHFDSHSQDVLNSATRRAVIQFGAKMVRTSPRWV